MNRTITELRNQYYDWAWASYKAAELAREAEDIYELERWLDCFDKYHALYDVFDRVDKEIFK